MDNLKGGLHIKNMEAVGHANEAEEAMLKRKTQLREFVLEWSNTQTAAVPEHVFERLEPHDQITKLTVRGYGGAQSPSWMWKQNCKLETLVLDNCSKWCTLPRLAMFILILRN